MFEIDGRGDAKSFHVDPEWAALFPEKAARVANGIERLRPGSAADYRKPRPSDIERPLVP